MCHWEKQERRQPELATRWVELKWNCGDTTARTDHSCLADAKHRCFLRVCASLQGSCELNRPLKINHPGLYVKSRICYFPGIFRPCFLIVFSVLNFTRLHTDKSQLSDCSQHLETLQRWPSDILHEGRKSWHSYQPTVYLRDSPTKYTPTCSQMEQAHLSHILPSDSSECVRPH